jgi:hypothetical protein
MEFWSTLASFSDVFLLLFSIKSSSFKIKTENNNNNIHVRATVSYHGVVAFLGIVQTKALQNEQNFLGDVLTGAFLMLHRLNR